MKDHGSERMDQIALANYGFQKESDRINIFINMFLPFVLFLIF